MVHMALVVVPLTLPMATTLMVHIALVVVPLTLPMATILMDLIAAVAGQLAARTEVRFTATNR